MKNPGNLKKSYYLVLVLAFIFTTLFGNAAWAQGNRQGRGLFLSMDSPGAQHLNAAAIRHRAAQVDMDLLGEKNITLNLFDDAEFEAERIHIDIGPEGEMTWSGDVVGVEGGTVNITVFGDTIAGSVNLPGELYEINPGPGGMVTIEEIDVDQLPPHMDPLEPEMEPAGEESMNESSSPEMATDTGGIIDLMVVYTQATRTRWGASGIQTKIINAVKALNDANARSAISAQFRLVYMGEVNYTETGDMGVALDRLTSKTDGFLDNVHALRDQYGADIVSMIDEDANYCGIAWQMNPSWLSNAFEKYAFNVTNSGCVSNHTLSHEIGHNEGCAHDRANGSNGAYPYSFGYRNSTAGFRTIMAYSCPDGSCSTRLPNFSNPNVLYSGTPTGIDYDKDPKNSADNARSKNNTAKIVANWRQAVSQSVPKAPNNLQAVAASSSRIDLSWADNSSNEDGFYVWRWFPDKGIWSKIATVAPGTTSFQDNGLNAASIYYYIVNAFNGAGTSNYSNQAYATTSASLSVPAAPSNLNAVAASSSQINLSWTDNAGNENGFYVWRWFPENGSWSIIATVAAGTTSFQDNGLNAATLYYYIVNAFNGAGTSGYSNQAYTTTSSAGDTTAPYAPTNLTASLKKVKGTKSVKLSWTAAVDPSPGSGIDHYVVYRNSSIFLTSTTSISDAGYTVGGDTVYQVHSVDKAGNMSASPASVTFTDGGGSKGGGGGGKGGGKKK